MVRGDSEADVFAIPDFRQTSKWLQELTPDASQTLFTPGLSETRPLRHHIAHGEPGAESEGIGKGLISKLITFGAVPRNEAGFFKCPSFGLGEPAQIAEQPELRTVRSNSTIPFDPFDYEQTAQDASDVWVDADVLPVEKPGFRTWSSFETGVTATHQPMLVSEAGPATYDALLRESESGSGLENSDAVVVETRIYISSLLALTLGRDSVLFRKDSKSQTFCPAFARLRISGFSWQVLEGVQSQAVWCGASFLQLRAFAGGAYALSSSRCSIALASIISRVLQAMEQRLSADGIKPRSLLQLQASIRETSKALSPLVDLTSQLRRNSPDEEILSSIFHMASSLDGGQESNGPLLREMLRQVSAPWIHHLEEWIGTKREEGTPLSMSRASESRGFVKVETGAHVDDVGREVRDADFQLHREKAPDFMSSDMVELIFETGRNLRFIRSLHPDHPLSQQAVMESMRPPQAEWLYDWASIMNLEKRVARYRSRVIETLQAYRRGSWSPALGLQAGSVAPPSSYPKPGLLGLDGQNMEEQLLASMKQLDQPVQKPIPEDTLERILHERLSDSPDLNVDQHQAVSMPHWSLLPELSLGGLVSAQAQIINRESLRLLFDEHNMRGHLKLQRDFHLFGNGMFCSRLSQALFDDDLASAERQAGTTRQGVMGLRLGRRDAWPPASSELRLVLMGVLTESHAGSGGAGHGRPSLATDDCLSFAVRDLSDEEIDRCMDPDSLEALDFLRLLYKTPKGLRGIVTPSHLKLYDDIFKLLLRVLRMQYVTNRLSLAIKAHDAGGSRVSNAALRFHHRAHHFVSAIASYMMDVGVVVPWASFEQRMDQMQASLEDEGEDQDVIDVSTKRLQSPNELRDAHSQVLDSITSALFLRRRQHAVLELLGELFAMILGYAKHARTSMSDKGDGGEDEAEISGQHAEFKKKLRVFVRLCRGLSEKGRPADREGLEGDGLVAQLLTRLDMSAMHG